MITLIVLTVWAKVSGVLVAVATGIGGIWKIFKIYLKNKKLIKLVKEVVTEFQQAKQEDSEGGKKVTAGEAAKLAPKLMEMLEEGWKTYQDYKESKKA